MNVLANSESVSLATAFAVPENYVNGCLRGLRNQDTEPMLEWMLDEEMSKIFMRDFSSMTRERCESFIASTHEMGDSLHFAVEKNGEYLGTISLKEIDMHLRCAEYAVVFRSCARGTGIASLATSEILSVAFDDLSLHRVYLNVRRDNKRAIRFYEKAGFRFEGVSRGAIPYKDEYVDLLWYSMLEDEFSDLTYASKAGECCH